MALNRNGFTTTVNEMITDSLIMAGVISFDDEVEGDETAYALRELNKLASRYDQNSMMAFDRTVLQYTPSGTKVSHTIGSGQGYITDRVFPDAVNGDKLVFDRDMVPGDVATGDTITLYEEDAVLVGTYEVTDEGPSSIIIDNIADARLDENTKYLVYAENAQIPDIPCVTPASIDTILFGTRQEYVVREEPHAVHDRRSLTSQTIPSRYYYQKGALGKIHFNAKAQVGPYQIKAYRGVGELTLGTTFQFPASIYIDLFQTALAIRLGRKYRRDMSQYANELLQLENDVSLLNAEDFLLEPARTSGSYYDLKSDGWRD